LCLRLLIHLNKKKGGSSTPSSCKYAVLPDKCLGSPQDLSLTHLTTASAPPLPSIPAASASSASSNKHHSEKSGSSNNKRHHHHKTTAAAASSPSSVSSVSSGSSDPASPGGAADGKNPNAPQIYPWMKRVHLGQSKSSSFSPPLTNKFYALKNKRRGILNDF